MKDLFLISEVEEITGVKVRTLQYWARSDFIIPSKQRAAGSGVHRHYTFRDVVAIRTAKRLRDSGVSLQTCRQLQGLLEGLGLDRPLASTYLVVGEDDDIYLQEGEKLISLLKNPGQFTGGFILDIQDVVNEVKEAVWAA